MEKAGKKWLIILGVFVLILAVTIFVFPMVSRAPGDADIPTVAPTEAPTEVPTELPTEAPTDAPTEVPTESPTEAPTPSPTPVPENSTLFHIDSPAVLGKTADAGKEYLDKIYFVGDSRTYSFKFYGVLTGGKNTNRVCTPESATMSLDQQSYVKIVYPDDGSQITVRQAVERKKPEYLCIGLGINGMVYMKEDYFKSEYTALIRDIQSISPNTRIMLQSIYPTSGFYERKDLFGNDKIAAANRWICDVAEATGVKYLNVAEGIADKYGNLPDNWQNGGGFHLNEEGNQACMNYIRTHAWQ